MTDSTITRFGPIPGTAIRLGITLFSLTNEWVTGQYTLDSLVERIAEAGIGPGIELVGFQSIRDFPHVDDEFTRQWRALVDRTGLEPSCLAINTDVALRRDRMLTDDELVDYLEVQVRAAKLLGFPTVRTQMGGSPLVIERLLRKVEPLGVKLGMEIHAPEGPLTPNIRAIRDVYDRVDSPLLGFIPDFSATMRTVPPSEIANFIRLGLPASAVDDYLAAWRSDGFPGERFARFESKAVAAGTTDAALHAVQMSFSMHGHESVEGWRELANRIVHVHGKFYEIAEDGTEPSIDIPAVIRVLIEEGYAGYVSSEWEGHAYLNADDVDPIVLVQKQHELFRRAAADVVS